MLCSKTLNHRIDRLHERALSISYVDYLTNFEELLEKDNIIPIYKPNLRIVATKMYKISSNLSPLSMKNMMTEKKVDLTIRDQRLRLRRMKAAVLDAPKKCIYEIPDTKTVSNGLESIRYIGPKIWKFIPDELKELKSLELFKEKVEGLKFENCPCKLCKNYVYGVEYID